MITGITLVGGILAADRPRRRRPQPPARLTVQLAAFLGGLAGLLAIPLEAAYVRGLGLGAIDRRRRVASRARHPDRHVVVRARLVLYFGGLGRSASPPRHHVAGWWRSAVSPLCSSRLGVASAYGGHGATGRWVFVGIDATVVHVAAMAVWIGGLVAVLLGLGDLHAPRASAATRTPPIVAVVAVVGQRERPGHPSAAHAPRPSSTPTTAGCCWPRSLGVAVVLGVATVSRTAVHGRPFDPAAARARWVRRRRPRSDRVRRSVRAEVAVRVA